MASFTFEAGNTRALLRLPLYALGALASLVVPRTDQLWVVGSGIGLGEGALPVYRRARELLGSDVRVVWLATTARELATARAAGFDAVAKTSRTGLWLTLRARVLVVTHGAGDVNRYGTRGGFLVQLWHGIPLKKLHLDSPVARSARVGGALAGAVLARGYRIAGARINLFPVASERIVGRIASAFGVPRERVVATGDPRDDVLLDGTPDERRSRARALLTSALGELPSRVVLYAPTWRDGAADPAAPDDAAWTRIADWLEHNDAALVVRIHPLGKGDYAAGPKLSSRIRLLDATMLADVNPILNAVDAIVTDYSSIAFDFALIDGPTVFLAADVVGVRACTWPVRAVRGVQRRPPRHVLARCACPGSTRCWPATRRPPNTPDGCATSTSTTSTRARPTACSARSGGASARPVSMPAPSRTRTCQRHRTGVGSVGADLRRAGRRPLNWTGRAAASRRTITGTTAEFALARRGGGARAGLALPVRRLPAPARR